MGKAVALLTQNDSFLDFDQAGQRVQLLRKELRGLITDFDDLPDTMQATLIDLQHRGELRGRTIDAINNQASIESIANTIKPSEYGAGNDSADRILAAGDAYNNMLSRRIDLLDKEGLLTDDLIDSLEFKLVLLKLNEAGLKKEEFILAGITAARKADRNLEGTAKDARIQELLGQIYRDNESSKKNKQLKAAEEKRKELDALVALREAEQQLFDLERDRAVGEGRNTKTDPTLNALRDKDKATGKEIDTLIKQVIGLYSELEQTPEVRQALAELAIQFDEIEVAAGRAREVILGWNDLGELATGSLRGGMDVFIKKIFEGVKGIRALESAFLNLISTFSAKIADVFLDLAAKSAVEGIGKLFGLLIGGFGSGGDYAGGLLKKFGVGGGFSTYHKGGQVKHGGSQGYDFDINSLHLPRHHRGKLIGLASDEVPAILQTGELVVPRDKVAEAMKGGGGGGGSPVFAPNIINTFSPEETAEAVINADNTDGLLINKMSKNPRSFKNA
ncbi:MAG: hypothetical protein K8953_12905, partial [Proteobacteria bacterium]|nr:hypothetical protein [Pseudomonadota bacterium]